MTIQDKLTNTIAIVNTAIDHEVNAFHYSCNGTEPRTEMQAG